MHFQADVWIYSPQCFLGSSLSTTPMSPLRYMACSGSSLADASPAETLGEGPKINVSENQDP